MKFRPGSVLSALLSVSLITNPLIGMFGKEAHAAPVAHKQIALVMLDDMTAQASKVLSKIDTQTINAIDATKTAQAKEAIAAQIAATKTSDAAVEALRNEARTTAVSEAKRAKKDLIAKIKSASVETLDRYGAQLAKSEGYRDVAQAYAAAYTRTEKAQILATVVAQDMDQVLAMTLKRLNWLNAEGLRKDLQSLELRAFGGKGDGAKIKRILLIAGAAIAFVGLATWGITAGKYAGIRNDRRDVLEGQFQQIRSELKGQRDNIASIYRGELDALVAKLTSDYNSLNANLSSQEMNFLNSNGYVRMQCKTYNQSSSIICNKYNYQVFVGQSTCSVMCYKNVVQGKETLHEAPICTSPYIPSDCFSQAMYDAEYNSGYNKGYNDKRPIGERDGREDGNYDGYYDGAEDGDYDGYADGYDYGLDQGYAYGDSEGYVEGYADRYGSGYETGYTAGFDAGYDAAIAEGASSFGMKNRTESKLAQEAHSIVTQLVTNNGYQKGYHDGKRDAGLMLAFNTASAPSNY